MGGDSMKEDRRPDIESAEREREQQPNDLTSRIPDRQGDYEKQGDTWVRKERMGVD